MYQLQAASGGKHKAVVESLSTTSQPTPGKPNSCLAVQLTGSPLTFLRMVSSGSPGVKKNWKLSMLMDQKWANGMIWNSLFVKLLSSMAKPCSQLKMVSRDSMNPLNNGYPNGLQEMDCQTPQTMSFTSYGPMVLTSW